MFGLSFLSPRKSAPPPKVDDDDSDDGVASPQRRSTSPVAAVAQEAAQGQSPTPPQRSTEEQPIAALVEEDLDSAVKLFSSETSGLPDAERRRRSARARADDVDSSEDEDAKPLLCSAPRRRPSASAQQSPVSAAVTCGTPVKAQPEGDVEAQVAELEAEIAELKQALDMNVQQQNFMGAHHTNQKLLEQQSKLEAVKRGNVRAVRKLVLGSPAAAPSPSGAAPARKAFDAATPPPAVPQRSPASGLSRLEVAGLSPLRASPHSEPPRKAPRVSLSIGLRRGGSRGSSPGSTPATTPRSKVDLPHPSSVRETCTSTRLQAAATALELDSEPQPAAVAAPSPTVLQQKPASSSGDGGEGPPDSAAEGGDGPGAVDEQSTGEESGEPVEGELEGEEWQASSCGGRLELPPKDGAHEGTFSLSRQTYDSLYDYQRDGVAWMARLWQMHLGGVLADEMGLGKTIQVCSLLNGARRAGATHALLALPMGLMHQWIGEAKRWCPGWPIHVYHGTPAQEAVALRRIKRPQGGLFITSYGKMPSLEELLLEVTIDDCPSPRGRAGRAAVEWGTRRPKQGDAKRRRLDDDDAEDAGEEQEAPREVEVPVKGYAANGDIKPWDIFVCDEAHRVKGIATLLGKSVRQFKSRSRVLLTGTPVQNALQDLWALMDFAQPGLLGNHATFNKQFSGPIERGSARGVEPTAVELKNFLSAQLRTLISPHILRRTKQQAGLVMDESAADAEFGTGSDVDVVPAVKQLIPKKETIVWLKPSEEQAQLYSMVLEDSEVIREARQKGKLGLEVFRAIGLLKRLCNHPQLIQPCPARDSWKELMSEAVDTAMAGASEVCQKEDAGEQPALLHEDGEAMSVGGAVGRVEDDARGGGSVEAVLQKLPRDHEALMKQSAKLRCLASLLPKLAEKGHRTLVFSGSTKMLDMVQICCLKPNKLRCLVIDGQTDAHQRNAKVAKFQQENSKFHCMLLTTSVGGVGLNLTAADRVVIVDPDWNPAIDLQAVDRAFRIGQEKEVRVYRLVISGFIEDRMFRLQVFKMGLTKTVLEAQTKQSYFTSKEIKALFEWTDPMEGVTRKLLQEKHGEDEEETVTRLAEEDGAAEGWFEAGPAVGLSDFSALYAMVSKGDETPLDSASAALVAEARQKVEDAEARCTNASEELKHAEQDSKQLVTDFDEAISNLELGRERRVGAEEALKERRAALKKAAASESVAKTRVEKARNMRDGNQRSHTAAERNAATVKDAAVAASAAVSEATAGAVETESPFAKLLSDVEAHFGIVGNGGKAIGDGVVDCKADLRRKALQALDKVKSTREAGSYRQLELDAAEEDLHKADEGFAEAELAMERLGDADDGDHAAAGSADAQAAIARKGAELLKRNREREVARAEQAQGKAAKKVDDAREAVSVALQALVEAGQAMAESFEQTKARTVKVAQVRTVQTAVKASLRPLLPSFTAGRKARDKVTNAIAQRRKRVQAALIAGVSEVECSLRLADAERELRHAAADEARCCEEREAAENALDAATADNTAAKVAEADAKLRKEHLNAAKPGAKDRLKKAKDAFKEASSARRALHDKYSKAEHEKSRVDEAKNSAVHMLTSEAYDPQGVRKAYEKARKDAE